MSAADSGKFTTACEFLQTAADEITRLGHYIVSGHFRVDIYACIVERVPSPGCIAIGGESRHETTTRFRRATIAWAGTLGELARDKNLTQWLAAIPSLWASLDLCGLPLISVSDAERIDGHPQRRRTFNVAARIIERNFCNLHYVAGQLVASGEFRAEHDAIGQKIYRNFLLSEIRATRARMGKACADAWAARVADENIEIARRDGLTADDLRGFGKWRQAPRNN